jgi:hypothetical protein
MKSNLKSQFSISHLREDRTSLYLFSNLQLYAYNVEIIPGQPIELKTMTDLQLRQAERAERC